MTMKNQERVADACDHVSQESSLTLLPATQGRSGGPLRRIAAFTLTELLVVITIILIMASLMGPTLNSALRGTGMTQGADKVIGVLSLAHQTAVTKNQTVEVRFYAYKDPETPGDTGQCHALQAFSIDDALNATPIMKAQALPSTVILTTNSTLSTLFSLTPTTSPSVKIPRAGTSYSYVSFRFNRSGATDLVGNATQAQWCVTIMNALDYQGSALPKNYTTVAIDPYNGSIKTYRPTL